MDQHDNERPQFARGSNTNGSATVDLRGDTPRAIVDVLDAVSMARGVSRTALVNEILGGWAEKVIHEASLVARVAGINPPTTEPRRTPTGVGHG